MSWLSDLFGGSDDGMQQAMMYQMLQDKKRKEEAARLAAQADTNRKIELADIEGLRTGASNRARQDASRYFSERGIDPKLYEGDIGSEIEQILSTVAPDDRNVGSYFSDIGQRIFEERQNAARDKALRGINTTFAPDFENQRVTSTLDDPIIGNINTEARTRADDYINNLLSRRVITDTGARGARSDLDRQAASVIASLNDIGSGVLESGRQNLRGIADRGRSAASQLSLGSAFDPSSFQTEADRTFEELLAGLDTQIRSQLPADLYDTSGLAAIAGQAQGGQNLAFDPKALAGIIDEEDEEDEEDNASSKPRTYF